MAEWFKAPVLKTGVPARAPWVRIPPLPPIAYKSPIPLLREGLFAPDFYRYFARFRQAFSDTWFFRNTVFRQWSPALRLVLHLIFIAPLVFAGPSLAQKLVDPNSVAPEFRDAAEKRRAEQIRVVECNRKANEAKVLPRDRTAYLNHCLEAAGEK